MRNPYGWAVLTAFSLGFFLFIYAPLFVIIGYSFNSNPVNMMIWEHFTFDWYTGLLGLSDRTTDVSNRAAYVESTDQMLAALRTSLTVAAFTTTISTVIGTASSADKIALAKAHGFDHVINYRDTDFVAAVNEITGGRKCDVVYDSVGKDTFPSSLDCLKPRGMFVTFGQSSGPIPPFSTSILSQKGSLYMTRPTLFVYNAKREDLEASAKALFDVVSSGKVKIEINQTYALKDVGQAQTDLENRKTTGTTILIP